MKRCHPIWYGTRYNLKAKYLNDIWSMLERYQLECVSMGTVYQLKEGNYTCQYYTESPHKEQAKTIHKYNIPKISNLLRTSKKSWNSSPSKVLLINEISDADWLRLILFKNCIRVRKRYLMYSKKASDIFT